MKLENYIKICIKFIDSKTKNIQEFHHFNINLY